MKRPSLLAEDRWRERPWPTDLSNRTQKADRPSWAVGDVRVWLIFLVFTLTWATWNLATLHFWKAVLPSALAIEAVVFTWLRRREVASVWRRRGR